VRAGSAQFTVLWCRVLSTDDVVVFDRVVKIYEDGAIPALSYATFKIPRGVVAGLLGPNGSGKTTSFKLIMGFLKPTEGSVRVFGLEPWANEVEVRRRIGYLPEKPVYPHVVVYKYLRHVARLRGYPEQELARVVKLTGLEKYLWMNTKSLSRGYLQRLGIAQALIGEPELLLLDEPTANLDPKSRREMLELIRDLRRELGVTIIVATHILPELQEVANYLVYINKGRVVDYGWVEDLANRYRVESYYFIETRNPRRLATMLIQQDFVIGVELKEDGLIVKINSLYRDMLLNLLSSAEYSIHVQGIRMITSELGELYEKLHGSG